MNVLNNKVFVMVVLIVGVSFLIICLLIVANNQSSLQKNLNNLTEVNKNIKKIKTVLPDIDSGTPIAESELRKKEISLVKKSLPYNDPQQKFKIDYSEKTQDVLVSVNGTSIESYRANKSLAEQVLAEFAPSVCNLVVFWGPPTALKSKLTKSDVNTTGCPVVFN